MGLNLARMLSCVGIFAVSLGVGRMTLIFENRMRGLGDFDVAEVRMGLLVWVQYCAVQIDTVCLSDSGWLAG